MKKKFSRKMTRKNNFYLDQSYKELKAEIKIDADKITEKLKLIDRNLYSKWKRAYLEIKIA